MVSQASTGAPVYTYEYWNGSAWTEISDVNDARNNEAGLGAGTTTAGLIYGGNTPPRTANTESWNGSSWTEVNNLNTARSNVSGVGTSTASLAFFGQDAPGGSGYTGKTESWNGSSWTEVADGNTARGGGTGMGQVYTACLQVGGYDGPFASVEQWDGSSWTEVGDQNQATEQRGSVSGTTTAGLIFGGGTSPSALITTTQTFDGSTYEPEIAFLFKRLTSSGDVVLDIGANDGVLFSNTYKFAKGGASGICIEPSRSSYLKLKLNHIFNFQIKCLQLAISHKEEIMFLKEDGYENVLSFICKA